MCPALAPQSLGSRCTSPFRGDAVGTRRQPHFRGETSPTSARPQSCKVLCGSPSAREAAEATLIKVIVLRVPGLEAGSAVRRVGCEGWHLPGTLLPAGFGISTHYQLPGAVSQACGISWELPAACSSLMSAGERQELIALSMALLGDTLKEGWLCRGDNGPWPSRHPVSHLCALLPPQAAFAHLALAFRCDVFTLRQRVQVEKRARDAAEENIQEELGQCRAALEVGGTGAGRHPPGTSSSGVVWRTRSLVSSSPHPPPVSPQRLGASCADAGCKETLEQLQHSLAVLAAAVERATSAAEKLGAVHQVGEHPGCGVEGAGDAPLGLPGSVRAPPAAGVGT